MTIGLCTMSKMTKLSCPSLPPSSPEVLRVLNHRCNFAKKIRFRSTKVKFNVYYSFSFSAHLFLADPVSFMHNGRAILHLQSHTPL